MTDLSAYDRTKPLPLGVDGFKWIITRDPPYYYVDKSMLIYEVITNGAQVNLIPRPRRFGKSLNLDMLHQFISIGTKRSLFAGLQIRQDAEFCRRHQGKYPVLHLDLKNVEGEDYDDACLQLAVELQNAAKEMSYLTDSPLLNANDLALYDKILHLFNMPWTTKRERSAFRNALINAPFNLVRLLQKHHRKGVVVLIDEYDVPLGRAHTEGYYKRMVSLIRGMFMKLLKGNTSMAFAVLTGCLPISKESIFTGMNNLKVWTGKNTFLREYFGFTEDEVKAMLDYYQLPELLDTVRNWYDGFQFDKNHVYCPWDVLSFLDQCRLHGPSEPQNFWVNTSGNDILKQLLSQADSAAQKDYVDLMAGKTIRKTITNELTFSALSSKGSDAIWSMMVATGYLTVRSEENGVSTLSATNREIRWLLSNSLQDWLATDCSASTVDIIHFSDALKRGDADAAKTALHSILSDVFPSRTRSRRVKRQEDLYPGILLGLLRQKWMVQAEMQSGEGYVDVYFKVSDAQGIVITVKAAGTTEDLELVCGKAMEQMRKNHYAAALLDQGCSSVLCYGIAFQKRDCKVMLEKRDR